MTELCINNLSAVLKEAGSSISKVVKVNVFLTTMDNFAEMVRLSFNTFLLSLFLYFLPACSCFPSPNRPQLPYLCQYTPLKTKTKPITKTNTPPPPPERNLRKTLHAQTSPQLRSSLPTPQRRTRRDRMHCISIKPGSQKLQPFLTY